ncbi:D-lactate dehydrogenase (cytochrome) [Mesorhizobium soli]|uniref:FAD-binding oxidoreductase n=1 Tax=Pseudaminobacter soli (ex Li et al. 2025) TaxID=1295366 RepID=UPI00247503EB|nr:FAD-linked oxidase C-terminal domain-containing protein [Mesorhizobium soli]MDH6232239.1 D-lactate dehydrogenase (cytochrome) [Mesorhizobium soli]
MPAVSALPQALVETLRARFGDRFQTGAAIRAQHGATTTWIENQPPDAVIFPECTAEVADIVALCAHAGVPVIPFGAGSSLEGQLNAPHGGLSIDLTRMIDILAVNAEDMDCVVQPGVTRSRLNEHLRDAGLFFPLDPGADATLGGMAATRASGTTAVLYGTMKDVVLSVEAVMPDGQVIRTGHRARKSAAGYDLTRLLVGSEGTLGIITELTLRLRGIPEAASAARCSFPTVEAASSAVIGALQFGLPFARIELLDATTVKAVNRYSRQDLPEAPLLLAEFHGGPNAVAEQSQAFGEIAREFGATGLDWTVDPEERARLWKARHDVFWAVLGLRPGARGISTDVCVPISRLAECIAAATEKAEALGLTAPIAGHVGDGNFHNLILVDPANREELAAARTYVGWLNELALSLEGTCTGEHGIGQGKQPYLEREMGPALGIMAAIKAALDPKGIMNPGKILVGHSAGR